MGNRQVIGGVGKTPQSGNGFKHGQGFQRWQAHLSNFLIVEEE
jgi:hypothetical protein